MNMSKIKVPKKKKKCSVTMLYMLSVVNTNNCGIRRCILASLTKKKELNGFLFSSMSRRI